MRAGIRVQASCLNLLTLGEAGSADPGLQKNLKSSNNVIQEKGYVKQLAFKTDETGLFLQEVGEQTYMTQMTLG